MTKNNYSVKEVAEYFSVSIYTVLRRIKSGSINARKPFGGSWRISKEELLRLDKFGMKPVACSNLVVSDTPRRLKKGGLGSWE